MTCPGFASCNAPLIDGHARRVTYLRVSVTDRCDLRCVYCMSEQMSFLPKRDLLSLEELDRLCSAFIGRGVRKLRITGGEPLVRRDVRALFRSLGRHLESGALDELTLTTNGTLLARHADDLAAAGVRRVNLSLDTRDPARYRAITRWGDIGKVMEGIAAAQAAGIRVKINAVALKGVNDHEIPDLVTWAHAQDMDITFIEVMPLGDVGADRDDQFLSLAEVRRDLAQRFTLTPSRHDSGGPARYLEVAETGGKIGFITPLSHNFCESCNRVRVTCTGHLYTCLGHEEGADLRAALRGSEGDDRLHEAIDHALANKPKGHDFVIDRRGAPVLPRHMSVTGG
ncbi:MAG: GTP 3',8-cyclase MoaA [Salinarimonas sp.]